MAMPMHTSATPVDETSEKARRAVKVFRSLQPTLTTYARILTRRPDVRVEYAARDNGSTDGNKIYFRPPIELGDSTPHERRLCDKRDEDLQLLCPACKIRENILVTIYHEIDHICFDSFAPPSEDDLRLTFERALENHGSKYAEKIREKINRAPWHKKQSFKGLAEMTSPFLPILVNALEDARVNAAGFKARPGTKIMFEAHERDIFARGVEQVDPVTRQTVTVEWRNYPLNMQVLIGVYCKVSGYDYKDFFVSKVVKALDDEELGAILRQMHTVRNAAGVYHLSFPILARLRELGFCHAESDPQPEPEEQEQDESGDEPGSEPGEESGDEAADGGDTSDSDGGDSNEGQGASDSKDSSSSDDASENESDDSPEGDGDSDSGGGSEQDEQSDSDGSAGEEEVGDDRGGSDSEGSSREDFGADPEEGSGGGDDQSDEDDRDGDSSDGDGDDGSADSSDADSSPGGDTDSPEEDRPSESDAPVGGDEHADGSPNEQGDSGPSDAGSEPDGSGEGVDDAESEDEDSTGDDAPPARPSTGEAGEGDSEPGEQDSPEWREDAGSPDSLSSDGEAGDPEADTPEPDEGLDSVERESADGEGPEEEDNSSDVIDTGADDGQGGVKVEEDPDNDENAIPYGEPEEVIEATLRWLEHDEKPKHIQEQKRQEEKAVDIAIVQGIYFETPSKVIVGVREHKFDDSSDIMATAWDHKRWVKWGHNRSAIGLDGDFDAPESILGPALLRMRVAFTANARYKEQRHLRGGKVDARVLGKRAFHGDDRIFRRRQLPGKRNYFVLIGVDVSGSTLGVNIGLEKLAVMAQCQLLARMGIPFAVYAHSGNWAEPSKGRAEGLCLDIYNIKEPDEPWTPATEERLREIGPDSANLDGHSLEFYRKVLDRIQATDKIIMYYTDGKMPAENHDEELQILQREIKICKQRGYTLMGVGIRTDSPVRHGLDTVQVDAVEDVVKVVKHLEKRLLTA